MFEERGEAPDDLARVQVFGDAAERLEIDARLGGARLPQAGADLVEGQLALEREEDLPFEIGELDDADFDHLRERVRLVAGLDRLPPHVADAEREDAPAPASA